MGDKTLVFRCPFCTRHYKSDLGWTNLRYHVESKHPNDWITWQIKTRRDFLGLTEKQKQKIAVTVEAPKEVKEEVKEDMNEVKPNINVQELGKEETFENAVEQIIDNKNQQQQQTQQPIQQQLPNVQQNPQQPNQKQQQPQPTQSLQTISIKELFPGTQRPPEFIENFLTKWMFKPQFIALEKYKAEKFGLPQGWELEQDALTMESGAKGQIQLIRNVRQFYEIEKTEYENILRQAQGYPVQPLQQNPQGQMYPQMYPQQPMYPQQQQMYPQQPIYYPQPPQQSNEFTQLMIQMMQQQNQQLQTQIAAMQQESSRAREEGNRRLEMEITELKNREQRDPYMEKMENKIELLENENRHKTELELASIKAQATNMPSPAQIQDWLRKEVQEVRTQVTAQDIKQELEKKIEVALQRRDGKTEIDVELVKAENEMKIEMAKLEAEKDKGSMWEKLLPEAMGVLSQGLQAFRSMPQKPKTGETPVESVGPPPYQENNIVEVGCVECQQIFGVPPGFKKGQCPNCGRIIDLSKPPEPQPEIKEIRPSEAIRPTGVIKPTEVTVRPPSEIKLGICMECKKIVTNQNLGMQDGRNLFCKECLDKKIDKPKEPQDENNPEKP